MPESALATPEQRLDALSQMLELAERYKQATGSNENVVVMDQFTSIVRRLRSKQSFKVAQHRVRAAACRPKTRPRASAGVRRVRRRASRSGSSRGSPDDEPDPALAGQPEPLQVVPIGLFRTDVDRWLGAA